MSINDLENPTPTLEVAPAPPSEIVPPPSSPPSSDTPTQKNSFLHHKKIMIVLAMCILLIPFASYVYVKDIQKSIFPSPTPTPTTKPTPTPLPPTPTASPSPTLKPLPTKSATPSITPKPSISPTPGQMGFSFSTDHMQNQIKAGTCADVTVLTSTGSTDWKVDPMPFGGKDIYWQTSSGSLASGNSQHLYICVSSDAYTAGSYVSSTYPTVFHDMTTGATKDLWIAIDRE